ncbi:putative hydroxymethylpyrimidine transporter CytX [Sinosporangium album]|uniref:Putative hydroxymethylpyrimidine transporter CytX n=1 Tax=Sinosporangium album TaxID=504805 RepID=A0A1G8FTM3_9ACTN|nr:cytosine permease [Sinosporangium album]SDH85465.1 putative hydroxymethylpyrimidine transporter CytX [Sinosporangium album]
MTSAVIDPQRDPRPDPQGSEAPLTLTDSPPKTLGVLDQSAFWANLGVSLLGFSGALTLVDPLQGKPLTFSAAIVAAIVGSLIGTVMVALAAIPGAQTGWPAMVLLRGLFGAKLSYVPTVLNIVQMIGWGAFELWVIAKGAEAIFGTAVPYAVWVIIGGAATIALTIWPLGAIRLLRRFVTIGVVISMAWLSVALFRQVPSLSGGSWEAFAPAVDYVIALSVSWVPVAADFARHSRSSGAAFTGVVGGYTVAQVACLALGIVALSLVGMDTDRVWEAFVAAPLGALFFGILVLRETDQSFANVYSTAMSLQNLMPRIDRRIFSVVIGVVITGAALVVDVNDYAAFLSVIGAVFVPMFAVLAVDYFLLGGAKRWNAAEDAPSRWLMLLPWLLGFAAYWLTTSSMTLPWWDAMWTDVRDAIGFTRQNWMNGALGAFLVSSLVTLALGLVTRGRAKQVEKAG